MKQDFDEGIAGAFKDAPGDAAAAQAIMETGAAMNEAANLLGPSRVRAEGLDVIPDGIAVLGSHPATKMQAPFDQNWLIYACSPHNVEHERLPRVDQWFEVHRPIADRTRQYGYLRYLENLPCVWLRDVEARPHFPGGRMYPEDQMMKRFCPFMFTSSIAYIMAKAIVDAELIGIKKLGLWGIMQASASEYAYQRPGIQYFIWEAARRDIKVFAPESSKLFEMPPETW